MKTCQLCHIALFAIEAGGKKSDFCNKLLLTLLVLETSTGLAIAMSVKSTLRKEAVDLVISRPWPGLRARLGPAGTCALGSQFCASGTFALQLRCVVARPGPFCLFHGFQSWRSAEDTTPLHAFWLHLESTWSRSVRSRSCTAGEAPRSQSHAPPKRSSRGGASTPKKATDDRGTALSREVAKVVAVLMRLARRASESCATAMQASAPVASRRVIGARPRVI
mmetsp:Transcript_72536/g.170000  ORF Transcript_72536/g.170000 Transcript_72536/m.170000 type:complete len:222 (+) Transcript_72536:56-721(+)